MHVLIDGDILLYRSGFAVEKTIYNVFSTAGIDERTYLGTFHSKKEVDEFIEFTGIKEYEIEKQKSAEPLSHATHILKQTLRGIISNTNAEKHTIYLTGRGNFRDDIATIKPYKGNRSPEDRPIHYEGLKGYLIKQGAVVIGGMEADDAMGIAQWEVYSDQSDDTIIASIDKDMNMIPGWHYDFVKENKYWVSDEDAEMWFYCQLMMGDTTDNIPGIPRVGKAKAWKTLDYSMTSQEKYSRILSMYQEKYEDGYAALMENAHLLWIRREEDKMWEAPNEE